jgi:hypothetical protein
MNFGRDADSNGTAAMKAEMDADLVSTGSATYVIPAGVPVNIKT